MPVRGLRQTLRGRPPFAPAYAHDTHRLEAFVNDLRGLMTVSDLAAVTGLSWDTVKDIVKKALEKGCAHPRFKDLRYLSMDEIYLGRQKTFYTLVIDLWRADASSGWPRAKAPRRCANSGGRCV